MSRPDTDPPCAHPNAIVIADAWTRVGWWCPDCEKSFWEPAESKGG